jgi:hypothetical protein
MQIGLRGTHVRIKPYVPTNIGEVKQIKLFPFTVTDIGGKAELTAWKAAQEVKQINWEAGKQARYEAAKDRSVNVLLGTANASKDINARADERYSSLETPISKQLCMPFIEEEAKKPSLLDKIANKFLAINFEPK